MPAIHTCGSGVRYGICPRCGRGHGYVILRKTRTPKTTTMSRPVKTTLGQALVSQITEAREKIVYWTRQRTLATQPPAKADAGARVLLWKGNLNALEAKLETVNAARTEATSAEASPNIGLRCSR